MRGTIAWPTEMGAAEVTVTPRLADMAAGGWETRAAAAVPMAAAEAAAAAVATAAAAGESAEVALPLRAVGMVRMADTLTDPAERRSER